MMWFAQSVGGILMLPAGPSLVVHDGTVQLAADHAIANPAPVRRSDGVLPQVREFAITLPDRIAVVAAGHTVTYGQLYRRVRQLHERLLQAGCEAGSRVAVLGPRSVETLAAFLATEALGAVYVPLDCDWPAGRIADVLQAAAPHCLLAHGTKPNVGPIAVIEAPGKDAPLAPDSINRTYTDRAPRYVIHTSGSIGRPKGVVITHGGLMNHLWSMVAELDIRNTDTVAFTASPGYVVSIWQMLAALQVGGRVAVITNDDTRFARRTLSALTWARVSLLEIVPSVIEQVLTELRRDPERRLPPDLRCVLSTGAQLHASVAARFIKACPNVPLLNAYGAAECSDDVALHRVTSADVALGWIPIGRPLPNVTLYLLVLEDERWRIAEPGEPGELWIGGAGVCAGYLDDPALTQNAFFVDGFDPDSPSGRLYRTGDLAQFMEGGIRYLGRVDRQVKISGVRVELSEVEGVISGRPRSCELRSARRGWPIGGVFRRVSGALRLTTSECDSTAPLGGNVPSALEPDDPTAAERQREG